MRPIESKPILFCGTAFVLFALFANGGCSTSVGPPAGNDNDNIAPRPDPVTGCTTDADCAVGNICDATTGLCRTSEPDACKPDETAQTPWLILAGKANDPQTWTIATAFPVQPRTLGTNAHVVEALIGIFDVPGARAIAIQHGTGTVREIIAACRHPSYKTDPQVAGETADVGLLQVNKDLPCTMPLGSADSLAALQVLDEITVCGFHGETVIDLDLPTDLNDLGAIVDGSVRPEASCHRGVITAIRFLGDPSDAGVDKQLIEYDLPVTRGTSSPW